MVHISQIRASIARLTEDATPRVAVFFGGTSGIGKSTINQLVQLKYPIRAYVVGRKSTEATMRSFVDKLLAINPKSDLVWVEAEASLLSEVKRVCQIIKSKEEKVDLLFLSAGYAPFAGRENTSEGLDVTHALGYYGRMLFVHHLLPLLRSSHNAHVVSVLSGSVLSRRFTVEDLHLEKPGAWDGLRSQLQMGTMNTLTMDLYAAKLENSNITFIHDWPGWVNTGNSQRFQKHTSWTTTVRNLLFAPIFWVHGHSLLETGERHLYIATGGSLGGKMTNTQRSRNKGLFLVDDMCDVSYDEAILEEFRRDAQEKVWTNTMEILKPHL